MFEKKTLGTMYDPLGMEQKRHNNGVLQKLYGRPIADNSVVSDLHVKAHWFHQQSTIRFAIYVCDTCIAIKVMC